MSSPKESSSLDKGEAQSKAAVEASPQAEASVPRTQDLPPPSVDGAAVLDHLNLISDQNALILLALKVILKNFNDGDQPVHPNARPADATLREFVGDGIVPFGVKTYESFDSFAAHFVNTAEFGLLVAIFRGLGHQAKLYTSGSSPDVIAKAMSFVDIVINILKDAKPGDTLHGLILAQALQQSNHRVKTAIFVLVNHKVVSTST